MRLNIFLIVLTFKCAVLSLPVSMDFHALVGSTVLLPCNITAPADDDAITLILWYKGDTTGSPVFSIDARQIPVEHAKHFTSEYVCSSKLQFKRVVCNSMCAFCYSLQIELHLTYHPVLQFSLFHRFKTEIKGSTVAVSISDMEELLALLHVSMSSVS